MVAERGCVEYILNVLENDKFKVEIVEIRQVESEKLKVESYETPKIEFKKINPTRYIVDVKGAEGPFTLVFSWYSARVFIRGGRRTYDRGQRPEVGGKIKKGRV